MDFTTTYYPIDNWDLAIVTSADTTNERYMRETEMTKMIKQNFYDYDFEDFSIERILIENGGLDELFELKDLQRRKLFLESDIDQYSAGKVVKHILQYNAEDKDTPVNKRIPILLYISSRGGEVDAGLGLIDAIGASETPVYTINLSYQYSMACIVGIAGHKRFAMPNATFLIHDGSDCVFDSASKLRDYMKFNEKVEKRIEDFIVDKTKITHKEYQKRLREEWYFFADEAKKFGVIDYIIGEDVKVEEIV